MTTPEHSERTGPNCSTNCADPTARTPQDLRHACALGSRVAARGRTWIVTRVDRFARCGIVGLASARTTLSLIVPIDVVTGVSGVERWHHARIGRVAETVLTAILGGTVFARLPAAEGLALLPWQTVAASAFDNGDATRVLLADAVGLGKTIQAGLAATALRARYPASRVLVLAPAGVRDQWADEWHARLGLRPWVADPAACRRAGAELPPGVTPWAAHSLVIASIDYVKQPEVLAAAAAVPWDLVIIDEAHNVGVGSDRRTAADALASSSSRVLLVTATPHSGQDEAFAALCAIGARAADAAPCLVRRTRSQVGLGASARLRILRVPPSAPERRMHDTLRAYARNVWDEGLPGGPLAMAWLLKRAASSPMALARSIAHRQAQLGGSPAATAGAPWLPFEDEVDERDDGDRLVPEVLGAPGLANRDRERRVIDALATDAAAAGRDWHKGLALARWLRGSGEPAIVFTEYRDTLDALLPVLDGIRVAVLHGGLSRNARTAALSRFTRGDARVLVATDVAGEGLNLQAAARVVVSLELPWIPARLEQRIGRVDRMGQTRPVRAACLVGSSEAERAVVTRLAARVRRASATMGADVERPHGDLLLLASALGVPAEAAARSPGPERQSLPPCSPPRDLSLATRVWSLLRAGSLVGRVPHEGPAPDGHIPWIRLRPRGSGDPWRGTVVIAFRVIAPSESHGALGDTVVALQVELARQAREWSVPVLLRALASTLVPHALRAAAPALDVQIRASRARSTAELARVSGAPRSTTPVAAAGVQPSMFDRRALTEAAQRQVLHEAVAARRDTRIARLMSDLRSRCAPTVSCVAAFVGW